MHTRVSRAGIGVLVAAALAACGGAPGPTATSGAGAIGSTHPIGPAGASQAWPPPSTGVVAVPSPTATASDAPSATPSSTAAGSGVTESTRYATTRFGIPLSVSVPSGLRAAPSAETATFMTWVSPKNSNNAVRFMIPAVVYASNSATTPMPPPTDFVGFLHGLVAQGASFMDEADVSVGGMPAHMMTGRTTVNMDGTLGCRVRNAVHNAGCYGLQPDVLLRIAVLRVSGRPLLIWARTGSAAPDAAFLAAFESMLSTVTFR